MSFRYKNYIIKRLDKDNIILKVQETKTLTSGKNKGDRVTAWELHGYYSNFTNAFRAMASMEMEKAGDMGELKGILQTVKDLLKTI